ncbi:MAG: preprotein translocase subunit SecE [candidate division Zixibacteria bacterium]|nr:preprotein translocase subunit SecE [candidate division Zixibacteria bacterium]MDD5425875.1 preprotein translocase subunit SecE [candidate division Zixibacteria bacterium]
MVLQKIKKYLKETMAELRKMTWPTKDELIGSTIITVVVSLIVSIFIGIVDRILSLVIRTIFGGGLGG